MNSTLKNLTITAVAIAAAITLAGCTSTPAPETSTPPAAVETAAPVETPAAEEPTLTKDELIAQAQALPAGSVLNDAQAEALRGALGKGVKAYKLPAGETILVKKSEPLPASVIAAEEAKLSAVDLPGGSSPEEQTATFSKLQAAASSVNSATGKRACTVLQAEVGNLDGPGTSVQWVAMGCPYPKGGVVPAGADKGAVIAEAEARIAAQPDAADWALIIEP